MSKFNLLGWASSLVLSKYLSPYFKNLENTNIDLGFWNGNIKFQKLELKREFFLLMDLDLDVEGSMIEEVDLIIPWKALQTEPVKLHIKGLKICVSHHFSKNKTDNKKREILLNVKHETLKKFDELIKKRTNDIQSGSYFYLIANNIIHNAEIHISNVELIYINYIAKTEIVKTGLKIDELTVQAATPEKVMLNKEKQIYVSKEFKIRGLAMYFDIYDDSFLKKVKDKETDAIHEELAVLHNYIINNFDIDTTIFLELVADTILLINSKVSPILLHFKQKQIRFMIIMLEKIQDYNQNRPKGKVVGKTQASLWWQYLVNRVMEAENTRARTRQKSFVTFTSSHKYEKLYMQKLINQKLLTDAHRKFLRKFEDEQSIGTIIVIREKALALLRDNLRKLKDPDREDVEELESWFKKYDKNFKQENILVSIQDDTNRQTSTFNTKFSLTVKSVSIVLRDNDIIDALKDLQNHVNYFSEALEDRAELKEKIVEHIKQNFVRFIANESVRYNPKSAHRNFNSNNIAPGNFNPKATLQDYIKLVNEQHPSDTHLKLLLSFSVEDILLDFNSEGKHQLLHLNFKKAECLDLLGVENMVRKVLKVKNETKLIYNSNAILRKGIQLIGTKDRVEHNDIDYINEVLIDVMTSKINLVLTKPFIERLLSLVEFLNFRFTGTQPEHADGDNNDASTDLQAKTTDGSQGSEAQDYQRHELFFNGILRRRKKITQRINISIIIEKINVFLPVSYIRKDWMLVLHVNCIKILKREYEADSKSQNKKSVIQLADDEQKEFIENSFQPFMFSFSGFRILITRDTDWELKENPFLYEIEQLPIGEKAFVNRSNWDGLQAYNLLEIYRSELIIEQMTTQKRIENRKYAREDTKTTAVDLDIFPKQMRVSLELPMIMVNLPLPSLYILMSLSKIWSGFAQGVQLTELQNMSHIAKEGKNQIPNSTTKDSEKVHRKNKEPVERNLFYSVSVGKVLEETTLQFVEIRLDGLILNLGIEGDIHHHSFRNYSQSSFMAICMMGLHFESQTKYFDSKLQLRLREFFIEDLTAQSKDTDFAAVSKEVYDYLNQEAPLLAHQQKNYTPEKNLSLHEPILKNEDQHYLEGNHHEIDIKTSKFDHENHLHHKTNPKDENFRFHEHHFNVNQIRPTLGRKEQAEDASSNLMLNFIIDGNGEANCLDLQVEYVSPEYNRLNNSPHLDSNIRVWLAEFVFVANPDVFTNLQYIFKYGSQYSNHQYDNFESFMKDQALWPELSMERDPDVKLKAAKTQQQEDKTLPKSLVTIEIPDISLIMMHDDKPLYFLNLSDVKVISTTYLNSSNLKVYSKDLMLKNISEAIGRYPDIAVKKSGKSSEHALLIEVRTLDEDEAKYRGYSSETSVKLNEMKLLFLNRIVSELSNYLLQYLLPSIVGETPEQNLKEETAKPQPRSDSKLSLLVLNSLIQLPRNSASNDYLIGKIKKLGLWSVGKWGDHCGRLIENGFFDFEKEENNEDVEEFQDAFDNYSDLEKYKQGEPLKPSRTQSQSKWSQREQTEKKKFIPEDDQMRIMIEGLQLFIKPPSDDPELNKEDFEKENLFLGISKKKSINVKIVFEDKEPLQLQPQTSHPMKIEVDIPTFKMFSYEPDFDLLMHFMMDNLGESATIVHPKKAAAPYSDHTISMAVHLKVHKALIKFFTGPRNKTINYLRKHRKPSESTKNEVISKNVSSFALIELHAIYLRMFMKNGGGNVMLVDISKFDLHDFRSKSVLCVPLKKIVSSFAYDNLKSRGNESGQITSDMSDEEESEEGEFEIELDDLQKDKEQTKLQAANIGVKHKRKRGVLKTLQDKLENKRLRKKKIQMEKDIRKKDLEKKKLKLEDKNKHDGGENQQEKKTQEFFKKLMRCHWCRREKVQKKLAEKNKGNQGGEGQKNHEALKINENEKENTVQISFNPQKDGVDKFFTPQDSAIKDLFGDIQLNIDNEIEIQTNKQNLAGNRGSPEERQALSSMRKDLLFSESPMKPAHLHTQQNDTHAESTHNHEHQNKLQYESHTEPHEHQHDHHSEHADEHGKRHYHQKQKHRHHAHRPGVRFIRNKSNEGSKISEGKNPKFIIKQYSECLQKILPERKGENFMDKRENDFFLFMEGGHNGEKSISMKLQNKTIILVADFLTDLVAYFTKPFNGSEQVSYWKEMYFNNCAPMNMKFTLQNASLLLLEDYTALTDEPKKRILEPTDLQKNCLLIALDLNFNYKTLGNAEMGPGSVSMGAKAILKKANILKVNTVVGESQKNVPMLQVDGLDLSQVSLLVPFKVIYNTNYHLEVYRTGEKKKYPAQYNLNFRIANDLDIKNNFRFAVGHFEALGKINANFFVPSTRGKNPLLDEPESANNPKPVFTEPDIVNSIYKVRIPVFNVSVYKILQETDLLKLQLSDLRLNMKQNNFGNSKMKAQATLSADYFNRRKVKLEPFIEPWEFMCVREVKGYSLSQLEIRNAVDPLFQPNERIQDNLHINSLNINLSTECIQTLLEVRKLFFGEMKEDHPYCIINLTGSTLNLTLSNSRTSLKNGERIEKDGYLGLPWKFFNRDSKNVRQEIDIANNAYIDVEFLEDEKENKKEDKKEDEKKDEKEDTVSVNPKMRSSLSRSKVANLSPRKANTNQSSSGKLPKDSKLKELSDKERPSVRQILCDHIGKTAYKIRKFGISAKDNVKSGGFFSLPGLQVSRKLGNDSSNLNLIASVGINKTTGMKEVVLRSPICFKNKLEQTLIIKIRVIVPAFEEEIRLEKDEKFAFPLNVDPDAASIFFSVQEFGESEKLEMKTLLKDKMLISEFNDEEMLSCDSENEFIPHKDGYKRFEKDEIISLTQPKNDNKRSHFCLTAYKRKVKSNIHVNKKMNQSHDYCWETYLVANPILYVTNAIPRQITLFVSGIREIRKIEYGVVNMQYCLEQVSDEVDFVFEVDKFEQSHAKKIFKRIDKLEEYVLKVKTCGEENKGGYQHFHMEVKKITQFCRAVTIYCPYLIINNTKLPMAFQESSFTNKTISVDPYMKHRNKVNKPRTLVQSGTEIIRSNLHVSSELEIVSNKPKDTTIDQNATTFGLGTNTALMSNTAYGGSNSMNRMNVILDPHNTIHMFAPVRKPIKLQISLNEQVWSKDFSLQSVDGTLTLLESTQEIRRKQQENTNLYMSQILKVGRKLVAKFKNTFIERSQARREIGRKKFEFSIKTETGIGILSKTKIITITPRFSFRNEMNYFIGIKQDSVQDCDENRLKLKPNSWGHFYWADSTNCSAVQMSISDTNFTKFYGWSGSFKIDEVNEFVVKLKKDDKENLNTKNPEKYYYARLAVTLDVTTFIIRLIPEDPDNPPYRIRNETPFVINYQQKSEYSKDEIKRCRRRVKSTVSRDKIAWSRLAPGTTERFSWDEMVLPHALNVEIESMPKSYLIDEMKDHEPLDVIGGNDIVSEREDVAATKKGYLYQKRAHKEDYQTVYCVLSATKHVLKVYDTINHAKPLKISLSGAKIDDMGELEFMIIVPKKKNTLEFFGFKVLTGDYDDAKEWIMLLKKAAFSKNPNLIYVKVEPINSTKVVTFYTIKTEAQDNESTIQQNNTAKLPLKTNTVSYKLSISNMISISLIDSFPQEVVCLTLKNLFFGYITFNDESGEGPTDSKNVGSSGLDTREMIIFNLDSLTINNQLPDTQFPVVLAPTKKKKGKYANSPFMSFNLYINSDSSAKETCLLYFTNFEVFFDTLEIRVDDQLIEALITITQQLPFIESEDEKSFENQDQMRLLEYIKPYEQKIDDKLRLPQTNKRIYMKMLNIEPIEIIVTFRNSPGYKMSLMASNVLTDFGLALASIDSAKINLNSLKFQHVFGSMDDISKKITKHYTRQFWNQLYKIFGSIELLGNPVSLVNNIGTGMKDMFYEPLHSLATGKETKHGHKFGKALAYGAASLVTHSVTGISSAINKIIRSIFNAIARLTRDKDWLKKRQIMKNRTLKSIKQGVLHGLKFLIQTIFGALVGICRRPYVEYKNGESFGFAKGIYQGIAGLVLKPPIALYDFIYAVIEGTKNSAKYEEHVMDIRTRPPRYFDSDNIIKKYDFKAAKAIEIIYKTKYKPKESEEIKFLDLIELPSRQRWLKKKTSIYVILTNMRFFYSKKESSDIFKIKLFKIRSVTYLPEKNQLCFSLYIPLSKKMTAQCVLNYESHDKAKPLLQAFEELGLCPENGDAEDEGHQKDIDIIKSARSEENNPLHTDQNLESARL